MYLLFKDTSLNVHINVSLISNQFKIFFTSLISDFSSIFINWVRIIGLGSDHWEQIFSVWGGLTKKNLTNWEKLPIRQQFHNCLKLRTFGQRRIPLERRLKGSIYSRKYGARTQAGGWVHTWLRRYDALWELARYCLFSQSVSLTQYVVLCACLSVCLPVPVSFRVVASRCS